MLHDHNESNHFRFTNPGPPHTPKFYLYKQSCSVWRSCCNFMLYLAIKSSLPIIVRGNVVVMALSKQLAGVIR